MSQEQDQERNQKLPWNKWKWGHNKPKSEGHWENNPRRDFHSIRGLSQEKRKFSNKQTLHLKELEKEQQTKPKVSRKKEIIKIRGEINGIEPKKK